MAAGLYGRCDDLTVEFDGGYPVNVCDRTGEEDPDCLACVSEACDHAYDTWKDRQTSLDFKEVRA